MATTWIPRTNYERRSWLLANGEIVQEPDLEETTSGRKVRVAGTNVSSWAKDIDQLIANAVQEVADQKQTRVWMSLGSRAGVEQRHLGFTPEAATPKLHFLTEESRRQTRLWWRFKHPTLPIEAMLTVTINDVGYGSSRPQAVTVRVVHPKTTLDEGEVEAAFITEESGDWSNVIHDASRWDYLRGTTLREFVRDHPPTWDAKAILDTKQYNSERLAVVGLLKKLRQVDELESIQILDLRDSNEPGWLDLELYESNMSQEFIADLVDYLDGTPSVEKAARLYQELLATLRSVGVVLGEISENDFLRALGGNSKLLRVSVEPMSGEGGLDHDHGLHVDLTTGTFVVDCSLRVDRDEVAHKWEEVLMVSKLSGEEDTLLAYAREYARRENERRAKSIHGERQDDTR